MLKVIFVTIIIVVGFVFMARFALSSSGFLHDGFMEGVQACKEDSECVWSPTTCCECNQGGGEIVLNQEKEWIYEALIKPICLGEQICEGVSVCHSEEIYCDRSCKFGKRTIQKPLLAR